MTLAKPRKVLTLVLCVDEHHPDGARVLLGMKKRGFGEKRFNGFGGKLEPGESVEAAAVRELAEEANVLISTRELQDLGLLLFDFEGDEHGCTTLEVHVFRVEWQDVEQYAQNHGHTVQVTETDEMRPEWFDIGGIPFDRMWSDDILWFPYLLARQRFRAAVTIEKLPKPTIADDEILARVTMRPINPSDVGGVVGRYPGFRPQQFPATPGLEGTAIIEAVGSKVSRVKVGNKVIVMSKRSHDGHGTWQAYLALKESEVHVVPNEMPDEVAAQFVVNPLTVLGMVDELKLTSGQTILQSASASVLGRMLIQYGKHKGIKTINLIRRNDPDQIKELKELGADHVIHTDQDHAAVVKQIKEATGGKGADGAVDCVSGDITELMGQSVANGATILIYAGLSGSPAKLRVMDLLARDVRLHGFWLPPWLYKSPEHTQKWLAENTKLLMDKVMTPLIGTVYPITQVVDAVKESQKAARGGKVLIASD
ncbi:hypothetical protein RI367_001554 [Sorochytrium milnesiophthora]